MSTDTNNQNRYWTQSRVELRAAGFDPDAVAHTDTVVTIASAYTNAHRCNNRVATITDLLRELIDDAGGKGLIVGAPAVSDALTQGTPNAGYSLVSRDVVADCFEIGHYAHHGNAMIVISGCDKTGAAALMPLARTNAFGLVLYPGTSSPGSVPFEPWASKGNNLTILDYAEGRAANEAGRISDDQLRQLEQNVMPGSGTCGAMFTANTMSSIAESIGMMLPRGASHPASERTEQAPLGLGGGRLCWRIRIRSVSLGGRSGSNAEVLECSNRELSDFCDLVGGLDSRWTLRSCRPAQGARGCRGAGRGRRPSGDRRSRTGSSIHCHSGHPGPPEQAAVCPGGWSGSHSWSCVHCPSSRRSRSTCP